MSGNEPQGTRDRILDAAGVIFAKKGFRAATVRQISEAAGVNVALLHYYFKDKAGLYQAVLDDLVDQGVKVFPPDMGVRPGDGPEARLAGFVRGLLHRLLSTRDWGGYDGKARLIIKELSDPTPFMDQVVERFARPQKEILAGIVSELLAPHAAPRVVRACCLSVVAQCLHYGYAKPVIDRLLPGEELHDEDIALLAEHVTRFSLGGLARAKERAARMAAGGGA
ncbi:CerR family C-terminal domain-containing protein [Desulfovibrio aminophilus]|nr:CerR family C-terminal domain-containing protein [Desulfovibrio aminophilus]MCM0753659.1 CerR family C-terminal domain-containing protein [Desulfovibrio aminophilus]